MPLEMKLYILSNSGIVQMIQNAVPLDKIRDHAVHSSLEITNVYTKFVNTSISKEIKEKCKVF